MKLVGELVREYVDDLIEAQFEEWERRASREFSLQRFLGLTVHLSEEARAELFGRLPSAYRQAALRMLMEEERAV